MASFLKNYFRYGLLSRVPLNAALVGKLAIRDEVVEVLSWTLVSRVWRTAELAKINLVRDEVNEVLSSTIESFVRRTYALAERNDKRDEVDVLFSSTCGVVIIPWVDVQGIDVKMSSELGKYSDTSDWS